MNYISHPLLYYIKTVPVSLHFSSFVLWALLEGPFPVVRLHAGMSCFIQIL